MSLDRTLRNQRPGGLEEDDALPWSQVSKTKSQKDLRFIAGSSAIEQFGPQIDRSPT